MEWFVHDYPMSDGRRLIELFDLEHRAELSIHGRRLLRQWLRAHLTLFEVLDGGRNGWRLADLLTGRLLEGARIPGEPPARWSLIVGRPLRVGRGYELSGARAPLPPAIKETLLDHLRGEFRRYRRRHEGAPSSSFCGRTATSLTTSWSNWKIRLQLRSCTKRERTASSTRKPSSTFATSTE